MKIKNIYSNKRVFENSHGGIGNIEKCRILNSEDFDTNIDFVDFVIIKPNETIGKHKHGLDEEIYFVIKGVGLMYINNLNLEVSTGDFIVNSFFDTHELVNTSDENIELLIFQVNK